MCCILESGSGSPNILTSLTHFALQIFSVSTDIPLLTGEPQVSVLPSGGTYDFQYFSSNGGLTSGSVTFTDIETGKIVRFWEA